jgi:hypothetical protein
VLVSEKQNRLTLLRLEILRVQTRPGRRNFKVNKNPQYVSLWKESNAVGPMSYDFIACKKITSKRKQKYFIG